MKTPSNEIYQLVKSLDSREKAFFRTNLSSSTSRSKETKAYVILFEVLNSLDEFNEEKLKQKLANRGITGKLSFLKNYLSAAILKSLEDYHSETRYNIMMNQMLIQADILINKNLFSKAFTIIKKGEDLARKTENFLFLCLFKRLRYNTMFSLNDKSHLESFKKIDSPEFFEALRSEENLLKHNLNAIDNSIVQSGYDWNNPNTKKVYENIHEQFVKTDEPISITAKRSDLTMKMIVAARNGKFAMCIKYLNETEKLFYAGGAKYIIYHVESFFRMIQNQVLFHYYRNDFDEIHRIYHKSLQFFNRLPEKVKFPKVIASFMRIEINYGGTLLFNGEFSKSFVILNKLNTNYNQYKLKDPLLLQLIEILFVGYYFINHNFEKANSYILKMLNAGKGQVGLRSQANTIFILRIISLLELGEFDQMENVIRSTTRQLKKNKLFTGFEKIFLTAIRKISEEIINKEKVKSSAISARVELLKLTDKSHFYADDERELILIWLDSIIKNRPLVDIVKEKIRVRQG